MTEHTNFLENIYPVTVWNVPFNDTDIFIQRKGSRADTNRFFRAG